VPCVSSRARRRAAFIEAAGQIYDRLEEWCLQNPGATAHEIELETAMRRRQLVRKAVALLSSDAGLHSPAMPHQRPQKAVEPGLFLDLLA